MSNRVTLYFKEMLAQFKGDVDTAIAAHNERKAQVSFKSQIAALEAKLIDDENTVADANEALTRAMYPTTKIGDGKTYIQNVVRYQEAVNNAQSTLDSTNKSLKFFKDLLAKEWAQVDAE